MAVKVVEVPGDKMLMVAKNVRNVQKGDIIKQGGRFIRVRGVRRLGGGRWSLTLEPWKRELV